MDHTVEEILAKLNLTQLKSLITLYSLEKPHSKSLKSDYITYIQSSNISLDPRMLVNFFGLNLKQKKVSKVDKADKVDKVNMETITDDLSNVLLNDDLKIPKEKDSKKRCVKSPERRSSKK